MKHDLARYSVVCSMLMISSCSVWMAGSGQKGADVRVLQVGATRTDIESQLGRPIETCIDQNSTIECKYQFKGEVAPSDDRMVGQLGMDIFTLGLWEPIGTLLELRRGYEYRVTVTYDTAGKLLDFGKLERQSRVGPPWE